MDVQELVTRHYGAEPGVAGAVLATLAAAGVDVDALRVEDLAPVDQLHAGGAPATTHLLDRLGLAPGSRLLDVGCGVGGPARLAAARGLRVTGVDLTPELLEAARDLTERVGLGDRVTWALTPAESLPLDDDSFEAAIMVHVGMNVPDKRSLLAEVHRVLAPGGLFAAYEQVRRAEGDLPFPMPWAEDERSSFVESVEEYVGHLRAVGFEVLEVEDRTAATLGGPPPGALSPAAVFGAPFVERLAHNIAATRDGLLGAALVVARA
ncbi:MAG: hypothetical protein JWR20_1936 [Marmoricola sp.]|nr:hypothetical protein [Marmoricola sp.]